MQPKNNIVIASKSDVSAIKSIQSYHALEAKRAAIGKKVQQTGFLVHALSSVELQRLVRDKKAFLLVSKAGKKVNGYFLAYDFRSWVRRKPTWISKVKASKKVLAQIERGEGIYFRHIAINKKAGGQRAFLEDEMCNRAKEAGYKVAFGEVLVSPEKNLAQFRTLKARGYEIVGRVLETINETKFTWAFVRRKL
ncbi:MAG: hypothetical protein WCI04_02705 [archaeon]